MNTSGEVADLMVKEGIQITESTVKLMALGAKNLAAIIMALVNDDTKLQGMTNMKQLIKSGKPLCIMQIKEDDLRKFNKEAKNYGVLFAPVVDKTNDTGLCDVIAKQDDIPQLNHIIDKLGLSAPVMEEQTPPEKSETTDDKDKVQSKNSKPRAKENPSEGKYTKRGDMEQTDSHTKPSVKKQIEDIKTQQKKKSRPDPERTPVRQDTRPAPKKKKKNIKER